MQTTRTDKPGWLDAAAEYQHKQIAAATPEGAQQGVRPDERLVEALAVWKDRMGKLPLGHTDIQKGASTYNWMHDAYRFFSGFTCPTPTAAPLVQGRPIQGSLVHLSSSSKAIEDFLFGYVQDTRLIQAARPKLYGLLATEARPNAETARITELERKVRAYKAAYEEANRIAGCMVENTGDEECDIALDDNDEELSENLAALTKPAAQGGN